MKRRFFPSFASLLLAALMIPGLSRAPSVNYLATEPSSDPNEGSPGQETNWSRSLHRQVKRYLPPRTPPYHEPEPNYKIVDCRKSEGRCQEYCNFMEMQVGYCSKKKEACCLHLE
uniref:Sperm associated antigen 11B n=1 Tax=Nannospalax galili TaxID=1026970 RepID=A0A8C6W345_NANGA